MSQNQPSSIEIQRRRQRVIGILVGIFSIKGIEKALTGPIGEWPAFGVAAVGGVVLGGVAAVVAGRILSRRSGKNL